MISSLLHLVGLRPRVYYTLIKFRGGGAKAPLPPPSIRQWYFTFSHGTGGKRKLYNTDSDSKLWNNTLLRTVSSATHHGHLDYGQMDK